MYIAYIIVIAITIIMCAGMAIADFANAEFVQKTSAEVSVPSSWLPMLATAKMLGAVGLLVGAIFFPPLAIVSAAGLVLFFIGALVFHVRARAFYNIYWPAGYLVFATASLLLTVVTMNQRHLVFLPF